MYGCPETSIIRPNVLLQLCFNTRISSFNDTLGLCANNVFNEF